MAHVKVTALERILIDPEAWRPYTSETRQRHVQKSQHLYAGTGGAGWAQPTSWDPVDKQLTGTIAATVRAASVVQHGQLGEAHKISPTIAQTG